MSERPISDQLQSFLNDYQVYVLRTLQPAREETKLLFSAWKNPDYWIKHTKDRLPVPSPIHRISSRVKRPESVADKIFRKPSDYTKGLHPESFEKMVDALGVRIVVYFTRNLHLVDDELRHSDSLEISSDPAPVAYLSDETAENLDLEHIRRQQKVSGYNSLHYCVRLRNPKTISNSSPWFEIQVRTLAQDMWAEVEHVLGYKPHKQTSMSVKEQFRILSTQVRAIDQQFNFLFDELGKHQARVVFKDADPLNTENLPAILSEMKIGCAQHEIDGLLKVLASRGVPRVEDLKRLGSDDRMERVRQTFQSVKKRMPSNFEMVASLASLRSAHNVSEEIELVKAQIAILDAWNALKKSITR